MATMIYTRVHQSDAALSVTDSPHLDDYDLDSVTKNNNRQK
jgi:hypothetical protein